MEIKEQPLHIKGVIKIVLRNIYTGDINIIQVDNLITNLGKESIAGGIAGIANKGEITYMAVGTDSTAPVVTNTVLGTELYRKQISVRTVSANIATFETFYRTDEANGTLREIGLFGGSGASSTDGGDMYTHAAINFTKSSAETMTVSYQVVIG